jgi:dipeptidyl aminopeptidase/acylaminoacyl peptidase
MARIGSVLLLTVALSGGTAALPAGAAFPGANGKIAFTSDRDGNSEIYVMNADGSGQTRLTNDGAIDNEPVWSPDGTKIAFWTERNGPAEIYVMNADGSGQINLTKNPALTPARPGLPTEPRSRSPPSAAATRRSTS